MRSKLIGGALVLLMAVTGCAKSEVPESAPAPDAQTSEAETAPVESDDDFESEAATAAVEEAFRESLGGQEVTDLCNDTYSNWQCYFEEFEVPKPSRLNIHLGFPGDVDEKALAEDARNWAANFLGWTGMGDDKFPELDTIVTYNINGVDLGTATR